MEIWKDVVGYEGLYQVSNQGRVRSLYFGKIRMLKQRKLRTGYMQVGLTKTKKIKFYNVHRLVSAAFIPNPDNLPEVNHKDEDKTNNTVENLEWCDRKYNINYGNRLVKLSEKMTNRVDRSKPILQYTLDGTFVKEWNSISEIKRFLGYSKYCIIECCRFYFKQAYGYIWRYKEEKEVV